MGLGTPYHSFNTNGTFSLCLPPAACRSTEPLLFGLLKIFQEGKLSDSYDAFWDTNGGENDLLRHAKTWIRCVVAKICALLSLCSDSCKWSRKLSQRSICACSKPKGTNSLKKCPWNVVSCKNFACTCPSGLLFCKLSGGTGAQESLIYQDK